ncbi:ABC transporter permease [Leptolinea tardivitalis]|uniref:Tungstate transporter permease n=1 Tax=Leptolinea tardivitalis TaxID=229920 RepID=A0A0P6WV03_9CHLR|nr:ABC transporter permease [Leptolinea tardivitalis]KPL72910.1 tungstate transporter permease [Leptolinea tardivitalis]GAP20698.1 ABC-type tungstate transport system, periplasmic component [Leptolinea tardivitalis]
MQNLVDGIVKAFQLLIQGDPEVIRITLLSLQVSGLATIISLLLGLPIGTFLALVNFPTKRFWISVINTGMALPPVVVGLIVSIFLWRSGPLGDLHLIYTPTAIVIAQVLISFPVAAGLIISALQQLDPRLRIQMLGLGASKIQMVLVLWKEARLPMFAAIIAAFGSVISEVGASMMVGGNLEGHTRVLTTAIVLETSRGVFASAIALSIILIGIAFLVNLGLTTIQQRNR